MREQSTIKIFNILKTIDNLKSQYEIINDGEKDHYIEALVKAYNAVEDLAFANNEIEE